jgi:hypothetical protein
MQINHCGSLVLADQYYRLRTFGSHSGVFEETEDPIGTIFLDCQLKCTFKKRLLQVIIITDKINYYPRGHSLLNI